MACLLARHACKVATGTSLGRILDMGDDEPGNAVPTPLHDDYSSINSELKQREQVLITVLSLRFVARPTWDGLFPKK
jgi:hypothetical protein